MNTQTKSVERIYKALNTQELLKEICMMTEEEKLNLDLNKKIHLFRYASEEIFKANASYLCKLRSGVPCVSNEGEMFGMNDEIIQIKHYHFNPPLNRLSITDITHNLILIERLCNKGKYNMNIEVEADGGVYYINPLHNILEAETFDAIGEQIKGYFLSELNKNEREYNKQRKYIEERYSDYGK